MKQIKDKNYAFRITDNDLNTIKQKAKKAKMTVTDYITKSALDKDIVIIDGLPEIVTQLKKIGNNLNQLTMLSHQEVIKEVNLNETEQTLASIYWKIDDFVKEVNPNGSL